MTGRQGDPLTVHLEAAAPADAATIAELIRTSKAAAMPWLAVVHTPEEDLGWVTSVLLVQHDVAVVRHDDLLVGVLATSPGWVDQLYVLTDHQGRGVGRALLDRAKAASSGDLQLWTFAGNARARAFYERAGFVAEEETDGSTNEERAPDVRYRWRAGS
ncbi:GNAT family N-acetyltransferase [Quadrisphaera setariae]|uniref:GNAT family N-acetyltransferase n=1 Tax=Quadrisphaera setariae TaxID=2593304 RepID=A0A5C8ZIJ3_9ACTN|nr:GNAT family N-acetyltransferase [Quadrisphaera setariae]